MAKEKFLPHDTNTFQTVWAVAAHFRMLVLIWVSILGLLSTCANNVQEIPGDTKMWVRSSQRRWGALMCWEDCQLNCSHNTIFREAGKVSPIFREVFEIYVYTCRSPDGKTTAKYVSGLGSNQPMMKLRVHSSLHDQCLSMMAFNNNKKYDNYLA